MKTKALGEICRPNQWKTVSVSQLCENGYPVYGANGVIGKYKDFNHKKETILVTCRGATCGTLNICAPFSYVNGNAMALDSLDKSVDLRYLYYFLKGRGFHDVISGSAQPQIIRSAIERIEVPICNIGTQKEITKRFTKIEDIIKNKKRLLADLDNLIKARFVEMFGDVVANDKNWSTEPISKVAPTNSPKIKINEMVWLLNLDMVESQSGKVIDKIIVSEDKINASTCAFDEKNVLYSKLRPYLNKVVLPDQGGYCTTELVPLKPGEKITREFLAALLRTDAFVGYINEKTAGTKMPRVSMNVFKQFECILPPIALQQQFSEFYKQVDKSKFALSNELAMGNFYIRLIHDCIMHGCIDL